MKNTKAKLKAKIKAMSTKELSDEQTKLKKLLIKTRTSMNIRKKADGFKPYSKNEPTIKGLKYNLLLISTELDNRLKHE